MRKSSLPWAHRIVVATGAFGAMATAALAVPITYTMSGVATGSLGAKSFSGAPFAVTAVADTSAVNSIGPGVPCIDPKAASFTIGSIGSGAITTPISVADNTGWKLVAFARGRCLDTGPMWTNGTNPQLDAYDLTRDLGPVALTMPSAPPGVAVDTSEGVLVLRNVTGLTFHAQLGEGTAEPARSQN